MMRSLSFATAVFAVATCSQGAVALAQTRTHALPASVVKGTSQASTTPGFVVILEEGGEVPSEPKATCDNRADTTAGQSTVGLHLEHYFPDAKMVFDQKVSTLRQHMPLKQAVEEAARAPLMGSQNAPAPGAVVTESLDGMEAAYVVRTAPCVQNTNPRTTLVHYHVRLIRDTTYADIIIALYASSPDPARKLAREVIQKTAALKYESIK